MPDLQAISSACQTLHTAVSIADIDDPEQPLLYVNHAFTKLTGYAAEEVVGRNCRFLQGYATDPASVTDLRHSILKREGIASCLLNYRKSGEAFHNLVILAYFHAPSGRNICLGCQYQLDLDRFDDLVKAHLESVQGLVRSMSEFGSKPFQNTLEALFMRSDSVQALFRAYASQLDA